MPPKWSSDLVLGMNYSTDVPQTLLEQFSRQLLSQWKQGAYVDVKQQSSKLIPFVCNVLQERSPDGIAAREELRRHIFPCRACTRPAPPERVAHCSHFNLVQRGNTPKTRTGPPEPPASFIGTAITKAPDSGRSSRFATFSRLNNFAGRSTRCTSKFLEGP